MKKIKITYLLLVIATISMVQAQGKKQGNENKDYIEFNDRRNVVHGIYLGLNYHYGQINNSPTSLTGIKLAYVLNQKFEIGIVGVGLYSNQDAFNTELSRREDLGGGYAGLHFESIFYSKSRFNLSFPLVLGVGAVGYIDDSEQAANEEINIGDADSFILLEPGVSTLFNISRYVQLEASFKYRFTNKIDLRPNGITNLNGFSAGLGIKVGIFNLGKNRYKKKISD